MSSIDSKDDVKKILKNGGVYPGDPRCQSVWQYVNQWGGTTFKLCYSVREEEIFVRTGVFVMAACLFREEGGLTTAGKEFLEGEKS